MIEVTYIGESLESLASSAVQQATRQLMHDIASDAGSTMHRAARDATPSRTGAVRDSWITRDVERHGNVYEARVENHHWVAHLLNYGTQPHHIGPKHKRAILEAEGPRAGADVSGIRPRFMAEQAVEETARTINQTTVAARERWAKTCEAAIEAEKRK